MELNYEPKSLKKVTFDVWTKNEILAESVCEITSSKRTVENGAFTNVENSLRDPRMGPVDRLSVCATCGKKTGECNGHFGHITLTRAVYHVHFLRPVVQWLRAICHNCGEVLLKSIDFPTTKKRVHLMSHIMKTTNVHTKCPKCGIKAPKYAWSKEKQEIVRNNKVYNVTDVQEHLELIPASLLKLLNVVHPIHMILEVLPVPPPTVRPAILMGGTLVRGEDDLTYRLLQILRINQKLKRMIDEARPQHVVKTTRTALQIAISAYIDHKKGVGSSKSKEFSKEYTSLSQRLKSKEGRVRGNLMGKRCDFTARTVITGDDTLKMTEVGIPAKIAEILTVPVRVTDYNKAVLTTQLREAKSPIQYLTNPNGDRYDLKFANKFSFELDVGWTVERHLQDGDIVLFNRQPTLHRGSLMAHTAKIAHPSQLTFTMNLSCTPPYNADFDGDEMNIHVPQGVRAQAEARHIMAVQHQLISAQSNAPIMSIIQDSMVAMYLLTQPDVRFTRAQFFACVCQIPGWDGTMKFDTKDVYTGHELFSMVLPMVNYDGCGCSIRKGILLHGQLTKGVLGTSHGSLIHVIHNDCGGGEAVLFINRVQRVGHHYLTIRGFTMSVSDILCSTAAEVHAECDQAFESVAGETDEGKINAVLNSAKDTVGKMSQEHLDQTNHLYCMVKSGSKGKASNISQILGVLGQQNLEGKRIPKTWNDRTLPHFKPGENTPASRGFVAHSYVEGLAPHEVWSHAISGREGVIDTAIKTARTGYIQRKIIKCLENLVTKADGTVRNANGAILQFRYGEDGVAGETVEKQELYELDTVGLAPGEDLRDAKALFEAVDDVREPIYKGTKHWMLAVPIDRIILNAQTIFNLGIGTRMTQAEIFEGVQKLEKCTSNELMRALIRAKLNSRKLYEKGITDEHFEKIAFDVKERLEMSRVAPGEPVGSLAAQSIGEYITQMTLNTFHNLSNSAMNVTLGIPRLLELLDCVKTIKTPVTSFTCTDPDEVYERMKLVRLEDIVDRYKVTDAPDESEVASFYLFPDADFKESELKTTLVLYCKEWYDVEAVKRCLHTQKSLSVAYTEGPNPVFHVKYVKKQAKSLGYLYEQVLRSRRVTGLEGASVVNIMEDKGLYTVQTSSTDLPEIWALGVTGVKTNDVYAIYNTLGIEAARKKLSDEIRDILAFYGLYVNARHIMVLVDWMCCAGRPCPLTRHGIKEIDESPLKLATFEEIVNVFTQSAFLKKEDHLEGVSERILTGAVPYSGGNVDLDTVIDQSVFDEFKQDPPEKPAESMWDHFQDDEEDIYGVDPWAGGEPTLPFPNQCPPLFHYPTSLTYAAGPPPPMFHQFAIPNQNQIVQDSSMGVSLAYDPMEGVPQSPEYDPGSPAYSPTSPAYSPGSPAYSPTSPAYESSSAPAYDPTESNPAKKRRTFFE